MLIPQELQLSHNYFTNKLCHQLTELVVFYHVEQ